MSRFEFLFPNHLLIINHLLSLIVYHLYYLGSLVRPSFPLFSFSKKKEKELHSGWAADSK